MKNNSFLIPCLSRCLFLAVIGAVWHFRYPELLLHIEETAFFADTPDFYHLHYSLPVDMLKIAANYMAQFYQYHWSGVLLQMFWTALLLGGCDLLLFRLLGRGRWLWISFFPAVWMVVKQVEIPTVYFSLTVLLIVWATALLFCLFRRCPLGPLRLLQRGRWLMVAECAVPLLCLFGTVRLMWNNETGQHLEKLQRIEHAAMNQQWKKVLAEVPEDYQNITTVSLRYFLLALNETEQLGEQLFHYPVESSDCFYFTEKNPVTFRFNSLFFWHLGVPNEALRYAFQECQKGEIGMAFAPLRRMTDWYMQRGDMRQAEYYLNLLSHTTCHDKFIRTRRIFMGQAPRSKTQKTTFFTSTSLILSVSLVLELDNKNRQVLDYLLCILLLNRELDSFYDIFTHYWPEGKRIPRYYEEALLMLSGTHPEIVERYDISERRKAEYAELNQLLQKGPESGPMLSVKFADSFWLYQLFPPEDKGETKAGETDGVSGNT